MTVSKTRRSVLSRCRDHLPLLPLPFPAPSLAAGGFRVHCEATATAVFVNRGGQGLRAGRIGRELGETADSGTVPHVDFRTRKEQEMGLPHSPASLGGKAPACISGVGKGGGGGAKEKRLPVSQPRRRHLACFFFFKGPRAVSSPRLASPCVSGLSLPLFFLPRPECVTSSLGEAEGPLGGVVQRPTSRWPFRG